MTFQIHYEVAAMGFLLTTIAAFFRQKHLKSYRNMLFGVMLLLVVLADYFDVAAAYVISETNGTSMALKQVLSILHLIAYSMYCVTYFAYVLVIAQKLDYLMNHRFRLYLPYALGVVACITTPWTGLVFYFNDQGIFTRGILFPAIYAISLFYLLTPVFFARRAVYRLRRYEKIWVYGTPILVLAGNVVQNFFLPDVLLMNFIHCLVVFLGFLFLQNSDYYLDEITGFFKMHGFEAVAMERMAYGKKCSYLFIRITNYNAMTEMYEDFRLTQIQAEMAKFMVRECGKKEFYHIAASTFAVVSADRQELEEVYRILRDKLPKVWHFDGEEFVHDYSYYILETPEECDSVEELFQRVAYARSDHKSHHKPGELIPLSHKAVALAEEKQRVAELVEEAIMDNSIEIYFQPIFSMEKKRITSLEVLARLKDRDKKFINPEFFIHVAEENRTILQLGEQIYRKACIFATQNRIFDMGIDDININLSPVQCCHEELAENLIKIAGEYGIPMSRMHLEITESGIMDRDEIMNTLQVLRSSGAKIALDDFGTGYSSMTSIVNLPVDFVKIDKSLVWSYGKGENSYLNQLVPMIHSEGKRIISEGIETQEHIDIFNQLGGDFLQGYFYSKPLEEHDFIKYLKEVNGITVV